MKLHLPTSLRAAVLACLAVAGGFTTTLGTGFVAGGALTFALAAVPQAQAAAYADLSYVNVAAENTSGDGNFAYAISLDPALLKTYLADGSANVNHDLITYVAAGTNTGIVTNFSSSNNKINASGLYYRWGNTMNYGSTNITQQNQTYPTGKSDVSDLDWDAVAGAGLVYSFSKGGGTKVSFVLVDAEGNVIHSSAHAAGGLKAGSAGDGAVTFDPAVTDIRMSANDLNSTELTDLITLATSAAVSRKYWEGGTNGDWNTNSWSFAENGKTLTGFEAGGHAIFKGDTDATITLSEAVKAGEITVENGSYTFTGTGNLNVGALVLGNGTTAAELEIATTGSKAFTAGVVINDNATLTISNFSNWSGKISGSGSLKLSTGGLLGVGNLNNNIGSGDGIGNLVLTNDTALQITSSTTQPATLIKCGNITIEDGSQFVNRLIGFTIGQEGALLTLEGAGSATNDNQVVKAALSFGVQCSNTGILTMLYDVELSADATVYVEGEQRKQNGIISGTTSTNGYTLTKTGTGTLELKKVDATEQGSYHVEAGTLKIASHGQTLTKSGAGMLELIASNAADKGSYTIETGVARITSTMADAVKVGTVTLKEGTKMELFASGGHRTMNIDTVAVNGSATLGTPRDGNCYHATINIAALSGTDATLKLIKGSAINDANVFNLGGSTKTCEFTGTLQLTGDVGSHSDTGRYLAINIKDNVIASGSVIDFAKIKDATAAHRYGLGVAADTVTVAGISSQITTGENISIFSGSADKDTTAFASDTTKRTLIVGVKEGANYTTNATIKENLNLIKNGTGTQTFTGDMSAFNGDITVNGGTLGISSGVSTSGRMVSLAAGTVLSSDLTVNGGALSLTAVTTGNSAAGLSQHSLTLDGNTKTALTLTIDEGMKTGMALTLLSGINACVLEEGATLSTYFDVTDVTLKSVNGAMVADEASKNDWIDRLGRSALSYSDSALVLTLAPMKLTTSPLYWEPGETGDGTWSGKSWAAIETDPSDDPGCLADPWTGDAPDVYFTGHGTATDLAEVVVDMETAVQDMTVEGHYSLSSAETDAAGTMGSLVVEGTLTVEDNSTVIFDRADVLDQDGAIVTEGEGFVTLNDVTLEGADSTIVLDGVKSTPNAAGQPERVISGSFLAENGGTIIYTGKATSTLIIQKADETDTIRLGGTMNADGTANPLVLSGRGNITLVNATLTGQIDNGSVNNQTPASLQLSGTTTLDTVAMGTLLAQMRTYHATQDGMQTPNGTSSTKDGSSSGTLNGYVALNLSGKLFTNGGGIADSNPPKWQYANGTATTLIYDSANDTYFFKGDVSTEYTAADEKEAVAYSAADSVFAPATALVLDGGSIVLNSDLSDKIKEGEGIYALQDGDLTIGKDVSLSQEFLDPGDATVTLGGKGTYDLGADAALKDGVKLDAEVDAEGVAGWAGTVITSASINDLNPLGTIDSTVVLSAATSATDLTADKVGTVIAKEAMALTGTNRMNAATFEKGLSLAEDSTLEALTLTSGAGMTMDKGAAVDVTGELTLGGDLTLTALNLQEAGTRDLVKNVVTAGSLGDDRINVILSDDQLFAFGESGMNKVTLVETGVDSSNVVATLNGKTSYGKYAEKYFYTLSWREADGRHLELEVTGNENWLKENMAGMEENAMAGATLLDDAFVTYNPQQTAPGSDIANVLDTIEGMLEAGDTEGAAEVSAAVAGASVATLGMALSSDVERQLQAIRNRTTTMGVNECVVNEGMPYFNAWVNAEGNRAELDKDGLAAGYTLDSWGGTVGFDVDLNPNLTMGLAVTAMYGDLDSDGPDRLSGDMDTYYVSLFARYASSAWTHTFVGTVGKMDGNYERTVNAAGLNYETEGELEGMTFGLMYELGYVMPLNDEATACLQPVFNVMLRHSTVDSYTEDGRDAALEVGEQTMTSLTFGLGTRLQAVVGENLYNRASLFEARVLGKVDVADRSCEADVAFLDGNAGSTVESAELGAFGVEIGAGLNIPLDADAGTIFIDASAEFRSGYTNVNGTVGYRINF